MTGKLRWMMLVSGAIPLVIGLTTAPAHARYFVTQWGGFGSGPGQFNSIAGIATDEAGDVYVADEFVNHRVQKFTSSGEFITEWSVYLPQGVDTDSVGNVYVTTPLSVDKFTSSGEFIAAFERPGIERFYATDVAIDSAGNVYVVDSLYDRVHKFAPSGEFVTEWGGPGKRRGRFNGPEGVATDAAGNVYVADSFNERVQKFTSSGQFVTQWGAEAVGKYDFISPSGIDTDSAGDVYVSSTSEVFKFSSSGQFITRWGRLGAGPGEFCVTQDVASDSTGMVYVTDAYNRVQKFSQTRDFSAPAPPAGAGPVPGISFGICNTSGTIKAKCPGDKRFRAVEFGELIEVGCLVDARRGSVDLTAAQGGGRTQSGVFRDGVFRVDQRKGRNARVTLTLAGGSLKGCGGASSSGSEAGADTAGRRRLIRRLRARARGRFRTRGRYSAATVRGTAWTTIDRCDGTLTKVTRGTVVVRDFRRKRTIELKQGESYLARAPR